MTISVDEYFKTRKSDRKKETRYLAVINKDNCTSCNACASQCPVDCIYEVPSDIPSESFHQVDTSRCIGCQLCYRIPTESTEHYNLEICPWNAIDMLHNPNVKPDESVLLPYYQGENAADLPWPKLEEYGYQFFLDGTVFLPVHEEELHGILEHLKAPNGFTMMMCKFRSSRKPPGTRISSAIKPRPRAGMCWTWFTKATSGSFWIDRTKSP